MKEIRKVDEIMYALIAMHGALNRCQDSSRASLLITIDWLSAKCQEAIELLVEIDPTLCDDENGYRRLKDRPK
jgi:hypothetical protein